MYLYRTTLRDPVKIGFLVFLAICLGFCVYFITPLAEKYNEMARGLLLLYALYIVSVLYSVMWIYESRKNEYVLSRDGIEILYKKKYNMACYYFTFFAMIFPLLEIFHNDVEYADIVASSILMLISYILCIDVFYMMIHRKK